MKTYIIHVSSASEREAHIKSQVEGKNLESTFVNEGDKGALTPEILSEYFKGKMQQVSNATSCAYKHLLAYKDIVTNTTPYAIILEDDIFLNKNFSSVVNNIIKEVQQNNIRNFLISLEDSNLKYVKGSERRENKLVYKRKHGRMTGAYLIDIDGARSLTNEVSRNKCGEPIDWFHNICSERNIIDIYWVHPTIAIQGSVNGMMGSLIDAGKHQKFIRVPKYTFHRLFRKLLWRLR